jgi:hypothetical protein
VGEELAPGPGQGVRRRRGGAYVIGGVDATMVKERGMVCLMLGGSDDGVMSHHDSCGLSCTGLSRRRREGGSNKREGHRCHRGSSLIDVDPSGGGVGMGETRRIGGGTIILLPFVQS